MSTFQELLTAARGLDASERVLLATALWDEIESDNSELYDPELLAEVRRRSKELDDGIATTSPWKEVRQRVRKAVGLDE